MTQNRGLQILAIIMLGGALFSVPFYAYYQLMNWVVMGTAIVLAWTAHKQHAIWHQWVFVLIAVLFNPLAPFHLRADIWQIVDIIAILCFIISLLSSKKK